MALSLPAPWYKDILQRRQLLVLCGERAWEEQGLHWVVRWQKMICDYNVQLITDSLSFSLLVIILIIIAVEFYFPGSTLGAEQTAMIFNFARRPELRPFSSSSTSISKIILIMIITLITISKIIITILSNIIVIVGININGNQQLVLFKSPQTLMKIENLSPNNNFPILVTFTAIIIISSIFPLEHIYKVPLLSKGKQC